jgi:hypothetical protein
MREDIQAYALGGMGCGNGVIAINLIKDLLQVRVAGWAGGYLVVGNGVGVGAGGCVVRV